ncbi:sigma-54-dependent Fis family transcriptional regulator [bacterium]|nr:sigma-54-dependent Fis family transcriptional regulator [bacterium]
MAPRILVADDESQMRSALRVALKDSGYETVLVSDGQKALDEARKDRFDMIITDMKMPGLSGMELLEVVRQENLAQFVVLITAYGTIDAAVLAMKLGALDFLRKPFSISDLTTVLERAFGEPFADGNVEALDVFSSRNEATREIITCSPVLKESLYLARRVALSDLTVLVTGESGTGKELVARLIHLKSRRANNPFIAVNCAAVPGNLLESELFGYEKGAFTGANATRQGKFEIASGGTILLDEIGEMPMSLQAKLLRVLQEREVDRVGGSFPIPIDTRVIATTNSDLAKMVEDNQFREDLFYRINVVPLTLPPLRERREDILPLAGYFCKKHSPDGDAQPKLLSKETMAFIQEHDWPGNVRELENAIQRGVMLSQGKRIEISDLIFDRHKRHRPHSARTAPSHADDRTLEVEVGTSLAEMERKLIFATLVKTDSNRTKAAELLGITVRTLRNKLNLYRSENGSEEITE